MSLRDFFHGDGRIVLHERFLSLRIVKESLEKKFRIRVIEESSSYLKWKIVRFARLYGAPVPFPNPTLELIFENENHESTIYYNFTCYDYYILGITATMFGISSATIISERVFIGAAKEFFAGFMIVLFFYGTLIFLDTKYLLFRIRKALLSS